MKLSIMVKYYSSVVIFFLLCVLALSSIEEHERGTILKNCLNSEKVLKLKARKEAAFRPWAKDVTKFRYNEAVENCKKYAREYIIK